MPFWDRLFGTGNPRAGRAALLGLVALLHAAAAAAQERPISLKGHWHLDLGRSFNPYPTHAKSVTLDVTTDDGRTYDTTETQVRTDGKVVTERIHALVDGKPYPVEGSPNGISVAVTDWAHGRIQRRLRAPNGLHGVESCKITARPDTMICDEVDTDLKGKSTVVRSVYVRD
jgi:hypothetical protein